MRLLIGNRHNGFHPADRHKAVSLDQRQEVTVFVAVAFRTRNPDTERKGHHIRQNDIVQRLIL
ncbi:hypothetical protein D3C80_1823470 [compost metagenome]